MKILHAYCNGQHRSAVLPIVEEMRKRGHEVKEVRVQSSTLTVADGEEDISNFKQDVFINSYPHIMKSKELAFPYQHGLKVCIEHGVNPIAWAFPIERHQLYDLVCLPGKWADRVIRKHPDWQGKEGEKAVMTGWPKVDALVGRTQEDRASDRLVLEGKMREKFIQGQPIIAFVPTHGAAWWRADQLVELKIPNLVIAPHEGRYAAFRNQPGAIRGMSMNYAEKYPWYIETSNIYEVLSAADLVISDYSSAMLESLVLDIPVLQLLTEVTLHNRKKIDPIKSGYYALSQNDDRVFKVGPNVNNMGEVVSEIDKLLKDRSYFQAEREFWRDEIFHDLGNATKNVCDLIESRMKK